MSGVCHHRHNNVASYCGLNSKRDSALYSPTETQSEEAKKQNKTESSETTATMITQGGVGRESARRF